MKIAHNHVTMDGEELQLLERYEEQFGETPPIYFLAPETSKRMIIDALRRNRPFNEEDLESESEFALIRRTVNAGIAAEHEVAALQPAARGVSREAGTMERTAIAGSPRSTRVLSGATTINSSRTICRQHPLTREPHRPGLQRNDINWLDQSRKTNLLESAVGISACKN